MNVLTVSDLLLWTRCRRRWVQHCLPDGTRRPALPRDMIGVAALRESARVISVGTTLFGGDCPDLTPEGALERGIPAPMRIVDGFTRRDETEAWAQRTRRCISERKRFVNGLLAGARLITAVDYGRYHSRTAGWELYLFRAGTGIRGVFEEEAAALALVADEIELPVSAVFVMYLDKGTRFSRETFFRGRSRAEPVLDGEDHPWKALFRESNLTRKSTKRRSWMELEIRDLYNVAVEGARVDRSYRCRQGCRACDSPSHDGAAGIHDVLTLHKGRHIGRELREKGITDIRDIDRSLVRLTERQSIQIRTVTTGRRHVDRYKLEAFLAALQRPLFFLDFEAYSQSIPPMPGLAPYEHAPVVAALFRQDSPGAPARESTFFAPPGEDGRREMASWIASLLGEYGTIVVFSKPFESAMVRQLAASENDPDLGERLVSRMVDLLRPFAEFMVYDPRQTGKVSLKKVLPIYTSSGYENVDVNDGMHANLSLTRQADRVLLNENGLIGKGARAAEGISSCLETAAPGDWLALGTPDQITEYCATDTRAMVELVETLRAMTVS